jgi:hypothetical protein
MSVSARTIAQPERAPSTIFVGLDVHKESVTLAVLPADASAPVRVDKLPYDLKQLRRDLEKLGPAETLRACYDASGAGYLLQRELAAWGVACTVIAPSRSHSTAVAVPAVAAVTPVTVSCGTNAKHARFRCRVDLRIFSLVLARATSDESNACSNV